MRRTLNFIHHTLARSPLVVQMAILLRNQCRCIIKYHLNEDADPLRNGEAWLAEVVALNSSTFIDVGANLGNWSSLFLSFMPKQGKGLLFEPSDYATDKLKQRFEQIEWIEVIKSAVSDESGSMFFFEEPEAGETSSLVAGASNPLAVRKTVTITTLDAEVQKRRLEYIDFVKIDAEGYDLHVLRGSSRLLADQRIGVIQFEYGSAWASANSTLAGALNLLESFDYKVLLLKSAGLFELNYYRYGEFFDYSNFIAVSPLKLADIKPFIKGVL